MKNLQSSIRILVAASLMGLVGCATKPPANTAPPPLEGAPPSAADTAPVNSESESSNVLPGSAEDLRANIGDTVHFDYDQYNLRDEDRGVLQRQAAWLQKYPRVRVSLEGHADERGTREYNLALGARRANAVKEYLVSLGVSSGRIETISYGKERPVCTESSDDCYAQNRRAVTIVSAGGESS